MPGRSRGDAVPCALCATGIASRAGEHVLPKWYLGDRDRIGPPPYSWSVNGERVRDRNGDPIERRERTRILLPVCEQCNGILERRFETPTKDIVRRLFAARGDLELDADEARLVGLWLAKTLLLQAHPQARYADPVVEKHALRWREDDAPPRRYYDWLIAGVDPPEGLSLWVFRSDESAEDRASADYRIPLPDLTCDCVRTKFLTFQLGWHGLDTTLVVHPGWPVDHPLERDGLAVRLLPVSGAVGLGDLPIVRRRAIAWMRCRVILRDGALDSPDLPPLSPSMYPFTALPELVPFVTLWGG